MCKFAIEATTKKDIVVISVNKNITLPQAIVPDHLEPIQNNDKILSISLPVFIGVLLFVIICWCLVHNKRICQYCFPIGGQRTHENVAGKCICHARETKKRTSCCASFKEVIIGGFEWSSCKKKPEGTCLVKNTETPETGQAEKICECNRIIRKTPEEPCKRTATVKCQNEKQIMESGFSEMCTDIVTLTT